MCQRDVAQATDLRHGLPMPRKDYPVTPDGRYFVSKGRLWRCTDPRLADTERRALIKAMMRARMAERRATDEIERQAARDAVDLAKRGLGERGPVWWDDSAAPVDRLEPEATPYAIWWAGLSEKERTAGD